MEFENNYILTFLHRLHVVSHEVTETLQQPISEHILREQKFHVNTGHI